MARCPPLFRTCYMSRRAKEVSYAHHRAITTCVGSNRVVTHNLSRTGVIRIDDCTRCMPGCCRYCIDVLDCVAYKWQSTEVMVGPVSATSAMLLGLRFTISCFAAQCAFTWRWDEKQPGAAGSDQPLCAQITCIAGEMDGSGTRVVFRLSFYYGAHVPRLTQGMQFSIRSAQSRLCMYLPSPSAQ